MNYHKLSKTTDQWMHPFIVIAAMQHELQKNGALEYRRLEIPPNTYRWQAAKLEEFNWYEMQDEMEFITDVVELDRFRRVVLVDRTLERTLEEPYIIKRVEQRDIVWGWSHVAEVVCWWLDSVHYRELVS